MKEKGYDEDYAVNVTVTSSIAGIMIPPSHNMILFAVAAGGGISISQLFLAGLIPGLLLALSFMVLAGILCTVRPNLGGPTKSADWPTRARGLVDLIPIIVLFSTIIGSIYQGWATPTEAAARPCLEKSRKPTKRSSRRGGLSRRFNLRQAVDQFFLYRTDVLLKQG